MRTVPEALEYPSPAWNYVFRSPRSCVVTVTAFALHARSGARHHLAIVNGAVLAFCYCLRDAPRKTYHLSQP